MEGSFLFFSSLRLYFVLFSIHPGAAIISLFLGLFLFLPYPNPASAILSIDFAQSWLNAYLHC